ncbi:Zn-dependent hydrolase [Lacibacter sp. MH-610]|uniref:Zn-dependent hydrolase n=1 Tax=Lacibacter sp. MH-610 TaxID=3020883 RepID=UPI003891943E
MHRRAFLKTSTLSIAGVTALGFTNTQSNNPFSSNQLTVNGKRMERRIFELAKFGVDEKGRGYRVAYTKGDIEGRAWFMELMKKAGLNPTIDTAGNIIGRRNGKNNTLKPISFGSHIDMVPDGGNYDGTLGSIAALEVMEILNENKFITEHPLELIIFANEEGGTIGSKAMTEGLTKDGLQQKSQSGLTHAEGIKALGGDPENIASCLRRKGDVHAWLELHIEQGGILEREKIQIGVVEGIVGIVHWEVLIEGFANHAGATPMNMRQDALLAASRFIIAVNEVINSVQGSQVGTVGKINVQPGAYNVIPGKVTVGLEIRDLNAEKIEMLFKEIEKRAAVIAQESKTKISFERQPNESKPALTDKKLQQLINTTAKELGFSTKLMQSGAGHDSQHMADIAPSAMIFIPSIGGISHSPKEFSTATDMENGANVLLQTILKVDKG